MIFFRFFQFYYFCFWFCFDDDDGKIKMKKIFNKNQDNINIYSNFIGKIFQVNKYNVQIEDVIAEGKS